MKIGTPTRTRRKMRRRRRMMMMTMTMKRKKRMKTKTWSSRTKTTISACEGRECTQKGTITKCMSETSCLFIKKYK